MSFCSCADISESVKLEVLFQNWCNVGKSIKVEVPELLFKCEFVFSVKVDKVQDRE